MGGREAAIMTPIDLSNPATPHTIRIDRSRPGWKPNLARQVAQALRECEDDDGFSTTEDFKDNLLLLGDYYEDIDDGDFVNVCLHYVEVVDVTPRSRPRGHTGHRNRRRPFNAGHRTFTDVLVSLYPSERDSDSKAVERALSKRAYELMCRLGYVDQADTYWARRKVTLWLGGQLDERYKLLKRYVTLDIKH